MKIKRVNEDFDIFKNYDDSYKRHVKDEITHIIMDVYGISEKYFKGVDFVMDMSNEIVNDEDKTINEYENGKRRKRLCAEIIYEQYIIDIKGKMTKSNLDIIK